MNNIISRRSAIKVGFLGGFAGLSLSQLLEAQAKSKALTTRSQLSRPYGCITEGWCQSKRPDNETALVHDAYGVWEPELWYGEH